MFTKLLLAALLALAPVQAFAEATIPTKDIPGAKDNPLIKRYDGSFIVSCTSGSPLPISKCRCRRSRPLTAATA